MKRILSAILFTVLAASMIIIPASATSAYSTYTYSADGFVLESPDAYVPEAVVDSTYIGAAEFKSPADIVTDSDGNVYVADAGQGCVLLLDKYYHYIGRIDSFVNEQGVSDRFNNPQGVFVTDDYIYICDTDNARIVMFEKGGSHKFVKTVNQPRSNLIESDAIYKPVAVAVDEYGRLFIVSSTTLEGIIVMGDNGAFYGFIGAQKTSASTGISALLERLGVKEEVKDENVSSEYNNIAIDKENFVYATISTIKEDIQQTAITTKLGTYAPVKKFNASGTDVMRKNGFFGPYGEVKVATSSTSTGVTGASRIIDAAIGPEGTWSIIDEKRSRVFTYDDEGNLLFAFGDSGNQEGNIRKIRGLCYQGDRLLVLDADSSTPSFTVFRRTEYGDILINALRNQNERNYDSAVEDWQEILKRNNNFDIAYIGIGKALVRDGEYSQAMEYFKYSHEQEGNYAAAYKQVRKEWASKYFILIPVVIVAVIVGLALFFGYAAKVNKRASLKVGTKTIGEEILYAFHVMTHPFDGFWDLKHEKRGSIRSAFIILLIVVATFAYQSLGTGYVFNQSGAKDYSGIYSTIISVIVPIMLWVISNWCLTTLFDGEGKFTDIFVATCYSLIPIPIFIIPSVLLSNVLVPDEGGIITTITTIAWLWVGMLLYVGMMTTHGYSFFKNFLTVIATIIGMAIIMFLAILFFQLMAKLFNLVTQLWLEISFRS